MRKIFLLLFILFAVYYLHGQQLSIAFMDSVAVGDSAGTPILLSNGTSPMGITSNDTFFTTLPVHFYLSKSGDPTGFWTDAYLLCNPDDGTDVYQAVLVPHRLIPLWYEVFRIMTFTSTSNGGGYAGMYIRIVIPGGVSQKLHFRLIAKQAVY